MCNAFEAIVSDTVIWTVWLSYYVIIDFQKAAYNLFNALNKAFV